MKRQSQHTMQDEGSALLGRVPAPWQPWERLGGCGIGSEGGFEAKFAQHLPAASRGSRPAK
jgi:hypothetical protein